MKRRRLETVPKRSRMKIGTDVSGKKTKNKREIVFEIRVTELVRILVVEINTKMRKKNISKSAGRTRGI